jgi:hypothetical protein
MRQSRSIAPLAIGLMALASTSPAMAWKVAPGGVLWQGGYSPGQSVMIGYGDIPKSKSVKADKCKVVKVPGKKSPETGNYYAPDGPIKVGATTYTSGFAASPGSYVYKCKLNKTTGLYEAYFAQPTDSFPFHHTGNNGEADLKGNIYFAPSGITAGNSYSVTYRTFGRRKAKANSCGIVKLNPTGTYANAGSIQDDWISSLLTGDVPKCKSGVIVP